MSKRVWPNKTSYTYTVLSKSGRIDSYQNRWIKWATRISVLTIVIMLLFELFEVIYLVLTGKVNFWSTHVTTWYMRSNIQFGFPFMDIILDILLLLPCLPLLLAIWNIDVFQLNPSGGFIRFLLCLLAIPALYYLVFILLPFKMVL